MLWFEYLVHQLFSFSFTGEVLFQSKSVSSMLCKIESICGSVPMHMIHNGKYSHRYFTETGLIYEEAEQAGSEQHDDNDMQKDKKVIDYEEEIEEHFYILTPNKKASLAARLGLSENKDSSLFLNFLQTLLSFDPEDRPSAEEALQHPWIRQAEKLSTADLFYHYPL